MAVMALTSVVCSLGGTSYADHLKSATLTLDAAELDATDFASGGWTEVIGGLKSGTLALTFNDDFADNDVDEDLYGLFGTVAAFAIKPTSSAVSDANPEYQGNVLVNQYVMGGAVGELAGKTLTFPISGAITRDVTA